MLFVGGKKQRYNEPVAGRTRLMKELFLLRQRAGNLPSFFEFRPYKYGPHSDEVLSAIDSLMADGYLQSSPGFGSEIYSLTPDGVRRAAALFNVLDDRTRRLLTDIKIQFNGIPLSDLLEYVYSRYPRFASVSEYEPPSE